MTVTPIYLRAAGEALYGARWQRPLARDLAVSERTMRYWAAGSSVPGGVADDLRRLLTARRIVIDGLLAA